MPAEEIEIKLTGTNDSFFAELDRRFDSLADRFGKKMGAAAGGGGGGAQAGATGPLGGAANPLAQIQKMYNQGLESTAAGFAFGALKTVTDGAARGIRNTPAGALGSESVVAQNIGLGVVGNALENSVGKIPVVGDYVQAQFQAFEDAVRRPTEAASNRLQSYYGQLAAYGVQVSEKDIQVTAERAIEVERRRYAEQRRVQKITEEAGVRMNSIGFGLSLMGF